MINDNDYSKSFDWSNDNENKQLNNKNNNTTITTN